MFGPASIPPHDVECAVPEGGLSGTGPPRGKYGKLEVPVRPSLAGFTSARGLCRGVLPGGSRTMHCVCQSSTARCPPKLIQRCRKVGMETETTRGGTQEIGSISDAAAVSGGVRSAHRLHRAARAIGWRDSPGPGDSRSAPRLHRAARAIRWPGWHWIGLRQSILGVSGGRSVGVSAPLSLPACREPVPCLLR